MSKIDDAGATPEPGDEIAFQAFWAWTNHPDEKFARKAWSGMLTGKPFAKDDPRFDPEHPDRRWVAPDTISVNAWRRVVERVRDFTGARFEDLGRGIS